MRLDHNLCPDYGALSFNVTICNCSIYRDISVAIAERPHPFPSRTRKLSSPAPMVLHGRLCGRVGAAGIIIHGPPSQGGGFFSFCIWQVRSKPPPKIHAPPVCIYGTGRSTAPSLADDVSHIDLHDDHLYVDPQYSWDDYIEA